MARTGWLAHSFSGAPLLPHLLERPVCSNCESTDDGRNKNLPFEKLQGPAVKHTKSRTVLSTRTASSKASITQEQKQTIAMTTKHYSPSSFGKEELIQGKFPDKGSAISDRKELTGLASLWNEAFGRKYKVLGGGSNSWPKVVCEQCNTRHAINPKGCVESSGQCRCPKSPVVKTNNVAAKFQTLGEARGAVLRIPICAAKGLPPPNWAGPKLRKSSSSIPVYCKLSSGDWFCFTIKKSRTRGNGASFELVGLPESDKGARKRR